MSTRRPPVPGCLPVEGHGTTWLEDAASRAWPVEIAEQLLRRTCLIHELQDSDSAAPTDPVRCDTHRELPIRELHTGSTAPTTKTTKTYKGDQLKAVSLRLPVEIRDRHRVAWTYLEEAA
jgi:hypothetical protein